ncbi:putative pyruvate/2-oxoglutarate dehydrogenase complex, dihydrolipoamide acyltransferase (E2) component [Clostridium sporogenes]|uniref:Putative pyruvate/2-oxoglutarate dehydrogenase complex, dihydrolipoamide acyltransferase (E2) component n=1 Tax=Clostridium sporogenes TaxID=1509 RepID=A0A1L3NCI5_CLOSG|nr:selenium-dependent molybdenum cofactor biosynthesis protein YqeB [Clostridium sporogenes]APH13816.1 putative pyruvate/2-oxoglutarate dehydrogenase complex, dihydrolipoamide acyltransferase (E2) component [Clostridium sporogenes]
MINNIYKDIVIVRGGGDLASGTIHKLHRSGFKILVLETYNPTSIRRNVCYSEAIYNGKITIENTTAIKVSNFNEILKCWQNNKIPITVDPHGKFIEMLKPKILVDAILAKKNLGTKINMAEITIGLGPGFQAGKDVHAVIETMRGHNLARIILKGEAMKNTGVPGEIGGYSKERVIYSPSKGTIKNVREIGDFVSSGEILAYVDDLEIKTEISGLLRGLIRDGSKIEKGLKIADVDSRCHEIKNCYTISDKARNIAGGVLEAILYFINKNTESRLNLWNKIS